MAPSLRRRALTASATPDSLTAAVSTVPVDGKGSVGNRKSRDQGWQKEAWAFFHDLGEIRFSARYMGNAISRCRLYVGTRDNPGDRLVPIPDDAKGDDAQMRDVLNRVRGRDGTLASLMRVYGQQQFVSGESFLVGEQGLEGETWEFLSTSEMRQVEKSGATRGTSTLTTGTPAAVAANGKKPDPKSFERLRPDGTPVEIGPESLILRFWQRDPEFRDRADSPMRAVLDLCEGLHVAQLMQTAGDRSRLLTAGVWLVPTEADLPKVPQGEDSGMPSGPKRVQLIDHLLEAAQAVMQDPGSPSSVIPILVEVKKDAIDAMTKGHITFDREVDKTIVARIDHLIRRLAQGLDLPPELLLGMADANHWSAWLVSEQVVQSYVLPLGEALCEDLTVGFLTPTALATGVKDPERYAVGIDPSELIVAPDRAQHAIELYDRYELAADHLMEALGFDPDQKPDLEEILHRIEITRAANPRNPDPGADIAALEGKAPPPTGAEKPVPGAENQPPLNKPTPEQPADQAPKGTPDNAKGVKNAGKPLDTPTKGGKSSGKAPPQQPSGGKAGGKDAQQSPPSGGGGKAAKTSTEAMLTAAATSAVEFAVSHPDGRLAETNWLRLQGTIEAWTADPDIAERAVEVFRTIAQARIQGRMPDWKTAVVMTCALTLDDEPADAFADLMTLQGL